MRLNVNKTNVHPNYFYIVKVTGLQNLSHKYSFGTFYYTQFLNTSWGNSPNLNSDNITHFTGEISRYLEDSNTHSVSTDKLADSVSCRAEAVVRMEARAGSGINLLCLPTPALILLKLFKSTNTVLF